MVISFRCPSVRKIKRATAILPKHGKQKTLYIWGCGLVINFVRLVVQVAFSVSVTNFKTHHINVVEQIAIFFLFKRTDITDVIGKTNDYLRFVIARGSIILSLLWHVLSRHIILLLSDSELILSLSFILEIYLFWHLYLLKKNLSRHLYSYFPNYYVGSRNSFRKRTEPVFILIDSYKKN